MTDNEFDDIIKKKLEQYEGDIPADMWRRITTGKKKRRGAYIWYRYLTVLLLLLLLVGVYEFFPDQNEKATVNNVVNDNSLTQKPLDTTDISAGKNEEIVTKYKDSFNAASFGKLNGQSFKKILYTYNHNVINKNEQSISGSDAERTFQSNKLSPITSDSLKTDIAETQIQKTTSIAPTTNSIENNADSMNESEEHDKFSLQLFASPDIPFSTIHSSNSSYEKLLNDAIAMKLSYTIGASISIAVNKRISLSGGVQYSRVNEKISGNDSLASSYHLSNHFSFLNVPITASYKMRWANSFKTSLKVGILFNLSSNYKGKMPDAFGELTDISHNTYLSNTSISIYTAVNFSKPVTPKLDIFVEPYFRFQTKNITGNLQPFTRKIQTAGLALGIEFKLFRNEKND